MPFSVKVINSKFTQVFNFGSRSSISNIISMINELDLLWLPNFIALGIYLVFGTKFSWNEGIDTCFNVEYMLLGCDFDFLAGYCLLPSGYWLLFVTAHYHLLLFAPTFSMNAFLVILGNQPGPNVLAWEPATCTSKHLF